MFVDPKLREQSTRKFATAQGRKPNRPLSKLLVEKGYVSKTDLLDAMVTAKDCGAPLGHVATTQGLISSQKLLDLNARNHGIETLDPEKLPADPALADILSPETCLTLDVVPWAMRGDHLIVAATSPHAFESCKSLLERKGLVPVMALAPSAVIEAAILARHKKALVHRAETRVLPEESCRDMAFTSPLSRIFAIGLTVICLAALFAFPQAYFAALVYLATSALIVTQIFRIIVCLRSPRFAAPHMPRMLGNPPIVSLLVPLYDEDAIASSLVDRLKRLDYPKPNLDVLLILEEKDKKTKQMLAQSDLPGWMRVVTVPTGTIQTKPRALNYALDCARGEIIGVLDAEDAPAPDQVSRIVHRFAQSPPDVACLQGILDYYNPTANWISRCFTIEYAMWFRLLLPGVAKAGFAVPLGGTTVYFRRSALENVGCWDAHNVTEDADLGIRLARYGYRTELVGTVTLEEANNKPWPWVKQRSRWLKGYLQTWIVHARHPLQLWRDLGPKACFGFHALFLGSTLQFLLAPVLWSFWLVILGLPHPLDGYLSPATRTGLTTLFLATEALSITIGLFALSRSPHQNLMVWVPSLLLYFPLGCIAAYKAAWELIRNPFYWDKTAHGRSPPQSGLGAQINP